MLNNQVGSKTAILWRTTLEIGSYCYVTTYVVQRHWRAVGPDQIWQAPPLRAASASIVLGSWLNQSSGEWVTYNPLMRNGVDARSASSIKPAKRLLRVVWALQRRAALRSSTSVQ